MLRRCHDAFVHGRRAHHQGRGEAFLDVLVRFSAVQSLDLAEQQFGSPPAKFDAGLADAGKWNGRRGGELDVVVADDADVVGDPHAVLGLSLIHI